MRCRIFNFVTAAFTLSLLLLCTSTVFADDVARQRMLELSDEATQAVIDGQFEEAAFTFRQAYETYPDPVLLKNEMIAWFRAGNCLGALPAGSAYLNSGDVTDSDRQDVNKVQVTCIVRLADEALTAGHPEEAELLLEDLQGLTLTATEDEEVRSLRGLIAEARAPVEEPPPIAVDDDEPAAFPLSDQTMGWALAGTGSALVVGALVYHLKILGEQRELREPGSQEEFLSLQEKYDKPHNRARVLVPTLYVLGAAALGGGAYFLMKDAPPQDQPTGRVHLTPCLGPGHAGASLHMNF
ncbi:MAG: hypothetical protein ACNA8W_10400 [Bradymonadaceae bacterium]